MGVDLRSLIPLNEASFNDFTGKRLGVDAFNWLYQFLSIIRQPDGTPLKNSQGVITSHLIGLFHRTANMMEAGIKPCYVFDGKPPEFKKVTAARSKRRAKAREEFLAAREAGNHAKAYSKAMQSARLNADMISDAKRLLEVLGIPVIQAPSEGEAQAAFMVKHDDLYAVATQDYDALLFSSPLTVRNLNVTGRRRRGGKYVNINPELIVLSEVLEGLGLSQSELIMLGILIGTDYNPGGVKGVGPKTGIKLVREYGVDAWKHVDWDWKVNPPDLVEFFLKPPVTHDFDLKWRVPKREAVRDLLIGEFEFSDKRVDSALDKIIKESGQSGLNDFV